MLLSTLKFFTTPSDNLSFIGIILSQPFLAATKLEYKEIEDFIFSSIRTEKNTPYYIYKKFQEKYPEVWEKYFKNLWKNYPTLSIYNFVVEIINDFDITKNFPLHYCFITHFLELTKNISEKIFSFSKFIKYFETENDKQFYLPTTDTSAVKVSTIHKSKGLEFEIVILPFFCLTVDVGNEINQVDENYGGKRYFLNEKNNGLEMIYIKEKHLLFSKNLKRIYTDYYKKSLIDAFNDLYVSSTRAKNELYIFVPDKVGKSKNKAKTLLNDFLCTENNFTKYGKKTFYNQTIASKQKTIDIPPQVIDLREDVFIETSISEPLSQEILQRNQIMEGNLLHYLFSFIKNLYGLNKNEVENTISYAIEKTKVTFEQQSKKLTKYESILRTALVSKKLEKFFYIKEGEVFTEKEIVSTEGEIKRVDRLIIVPDKVVVVDYKNSKENLELSKKQVSEYVDILKKIYSEKKVEGIIIYFDSLEYDRVKIL